MEADAVDAARRVGACVVRGPLFGIAANGPGDEERWRVVVPVVDGCPQLARDGLNSKLWFEAKDTDDRVLRRKLLAAVARLETESVNELSVAGTRYRVVRADEFMFLGGDGPETPRATDPEPLIPTWDRSTREPGVDDGLVLDPDAALTPVQAAEAHAVRGLRYRAERYPLDVRTDSESAVRTHPDVLLLPPAFCVVKRTGTGWEPVSGPHATPHAARRSLEFALSWLWPQMHGIPDGDPRRGDYDRAAADFRAAARANSLSFQDTTYLIVRMRRLMRWGLDGPETARPSDVNLQEPTRLHPHMDEDGKITHEE